MNKELLKQLAERIMSGLATEDEIVLYNDWFNKVNRENKEAIKGADIKEKVLLQKINQQIRKKRALEFIYKLRYWNVAAVLFVLIGTGFWHFNKNQIQVSNTTVSVNGNSNVAPGKSQAILTLANGQNVLLDSANAGKIAEQSGSFVTKSDNDELVYHSLNNADAQSVTYNELKTPLGGQYKITLQDGTKVWLNSASSIKFPTRFNQKERTVQVTGEVYFEVAHNSKQPFVVAANEVEIEVLGTHFNVNAYKDDGNIKTTLLEGAVKISNSSKSILMAPGQQAVVTEASKNITIKKVNTENVVAWTQGFLFLENANVKEFMSNLARWYNIEIVYEGKIPLTNIGGLINRNTNLSDILKALASGGIHTKLEGRKVIVSN